MQWYEVIVACVGSGAAMGVLGFLLGENYQRRVQAKERIRFVKTALAVDAPTGTGIVTSSAATEINRAQTGLSAARFDARRPRLDG